MQMKISKLPFEFHKFPNPLAPQTKSIEPKVNAIRFWCWKYSKQYNIEIILKPFNWLTVHERWHAIIAYHQHTHTQFWWAIGYLLLETLHFLNFSFPFFQLTLLCQSQRNESHVSVRWVRIWIQQQQKKKYWNALMVDDYEKRLSRYCHFTYHVTKREFSSGFQHSYQFHRSHTQVYAQNFVKRNIDCLLTCLYARVWNMCKKTS